MQAQLLALPSAAEICGSRVPIEYDVESGGDEGTSVGVARLVLPERLARTVRDDDLPTLDRPLRFVVHRGQRAAVHASTELRDLLSAVGTGVPARSSGGGAPTEGAPATADRAGVSWSTRRSRGPASAPSWSAVSYDSVR
ncbi:MAG: hypothetical protein U0163_15290 [Gemmatimonadaceae bacterium]